MRMWIYSDSGRRSWCLFFGCFWFWLKVWCKELQSDWPCKCLIFSHHLVHTAYPWVFAFDTYRQGLVNYSILYACHMFLFHGTWRGSEHSSSHSNHGVFWKNGHIWVFPKIGVPQNGWFIMENPIKMDDLAYHCFWKHPYRYTIIYVYLKGTYNLRQIIGRPHTNPKIQKNSGFQISSQFAQGDSSQFAQGDVQLSLLTNLHWYLPQTSPTHPRCFSRNVRGYPPQPVGMPNGRGDAERKWSPALKSSKIYSDYTYLYIPVYICIYI